ARPWGSPPRRRTRALLSSTLRRPLVGATDRPEHAPRNRGRGTSSRTMCLITYSVEGVDVAATDARPRMGWVAGWLPVALVVLLLGGSFAAFELELGDRLGIAHQQPAAPEQVAAPPGLELPELAEGEPVAAPAAEATPSARAIRAALRRVLRRPALGDHVVAAVG